MLYLDQFHRSLCLVSFQPLCSCYVLSIFTRKVIKNAEGELFSTILFFRQSWKNIYRQRFALPHKTMLCDFYKDLRFTSISQLC